MVNPTALKTHPSRYFIDFQYYSIYDVKNPAIPKRNQIYFFKYLKTLWRVTMSGMHSVAYRLTDSLSDTFKNAFRATIGDFYGRTVRGVQNLPQLLKNNPNVVLGVIVTTNIIFFTILNSITNWLNTKLENKYHLNLEQKTQKYILFDGIIVGGLVLGFNILVSKASSYPLSKITLAAITTAAIALRYFACHRSPKDEIAQEEAKKAQENQAVKNAQKEEAAPKNAQEEEEAAKKVQEEEARKKEVMNLLIKEVAKNANEKVNTPKKALEKEISTPEAQEEAAKNANEKVNTPKKALEKEISTPEAQEEAAKIADEKVNTPKKALEKEISALKPQEEAAKIAREEAEAKRKAQEETAANLKAVEDSLKIAKEKDTSAKMERIEADKKARDEANKLALEEGAAKIKVREEALEKARIKEEESARIAREEEAELRKAQEEAAATKRALEEEALKAKEQEEAERKAQEAAIAKSLLDETTLKANPLQYLLNNRTFINPVFTKSKKFGATQKIFGIDHTIIRQNLSFAIKHLSPNKKPLEKRNVSQKYAAFRKQGEELVRLAERDQLVSKKEESQLK